MYKPGYAYYIKDSFFEKVQDNKLMANKENGNFRPTYYCMKDESTQLLWVVPMSSRIEKYQSIYDKQIEKYGKCNTIVIGEFGGKNRPFYYKTCFQLLSPILTIYIRLMVIQYLFIQLCRKI
jgi:hypothetical protein